MTAFKLKIFTYTNIKYIKINNNKLNISRNNYKLYKKNMKKNTKK